MTLPIMQFELGSLTIWSTTSFLPAPAAAAAAQAVRAAVSGNDPQVSKFDSSPDRDTILWLIASAWHEKRHFFDVCLTNYGARLFRIMFEIGGNFNFVIADAMERKVPIFLPVQFYDCPIARKRLGEPMPQVTSMAKRIRLLKEFATKLDRAVEFDGDTLHVGGRAQLEGLAQASQNAVMEERYGLETYVALSESRLRKFSPYGEYRMIEQCAAALGCVNQISADKALVHLGLASAIFFTALCGRFHEKEPISADLITPRVRFERLFEELRDKGHFAMREEEAWTLVDATARRLWGRTALEEIEADIESSEGKLSELEVTFAFTALPHAFADFNALRRRLLTAVKALGPSSLAPSAFSGRWLDRLIPFHVEVRPEGSNNDCGAPVIFGDSLPLPAAMEGVLPSTVHWAYLYEPVAGNKDHFALLDRDAWREMLVRYYPRAQLALNGRNWRKMLPPELEQQIKEIRELGVDIKFHHQFEWPASRDAATRAEEALEFAELSGRTCFTCDVSDCEISPEEASVLTPWEFRRSSLGKDLAAQKGSAEYFLQRNWSDWIVRSDLL